jgi:cyclopropane-fatty-acyl-phospholipid synthase
MATLSDIAFTYDDLDELWPLILGDHPDATAAFYNGDYDKTLAQAQRDKHDWVLAGIGFELGNRVIDIGCGWGPLVHAIQQQEGQCVGLTLSPRQAETCRRSGFDVQLLDWKEADPAKLGRFDAVVSLGAFEHFCSFEEYLAGQQESVYRDFFKLCSDLLPAGGKLYLQTMTWGPAVPWAGRQATQVDIDRVMALKTSKYSDEYILGHVGALFPGSWLPGGQEQIVRIAAPYFELIEANDGRLDYIQTLTEWIKAWYAPAPGKTWALMKLWPRYIFGGKMYRAKLRCIAENMLREVFIRRLFGHRRMFFAKKR